MTPERTRIEMFWNKVEKMGTVSDGCWEWRGSQTGSGYGQFWNGERNIPAHWFLLDHPPTKGLEACHRCDNKICVRPSHIFIGTRSDNMRDMVSKGRNNSRPGCLAMLKVRRSNCGAGNHQSVLSDGDAATIKAIAPGYGRGAAVAKHFGVSGSVISGIWKGKRWNHVVPDASALQRAEAFLRTVGKWSETPDGSKLQPLKP